MSSVYPEKIALYFSSMNSLSAKIFADIQAVEDTVKIDNNLSYNEKSKIIDKHLIHDVIHRNKKKQQQLKGTGKGVTTTQDNEEDIPANQIFYNDPELDKDQVTALLLSVYPKKPEKYIYEDNSFYLDEHSEPFSYCTQSQASFCQLEQLVKSLPLPSISIQSSFASKKSDSKSRIGTGSHREKKPAPLPNVALGQKNSMDPKQEQQHQAPTTISTPAQHKQKQTMVSALGVPIMGFGVMSNSSLKSEKKYNQSQNVETGDDNGSNNKDLNKSQNDEELNLPKQVQNLDLIAELQAKLKMNKKSGTQQNTTTQSKVRTGSGQVTKPKAPPPPPPKLTAVKLCESLQGTANKSENPNESATNSNKSSKAQPDVQSTSSRVKESCAKETDDDFCVDVSSPCRIATKKTGFAFLDNW